MNRKNKAFAFIAAVAVSLSLTTGVMAQRNSTQDVENVTATLAAGTCSVALTAQGNLGTWNYTGTGYALAANSSSTVNLSASITAGSPSGCEVTVEVNAPQGRGGTIGLERFSGTFEGQSVGSLQPMYSASGVDTGVYDGTLTLNSVPNDYTTGNYTGTVLVRLSNTQ